MRVKFEGKEYDVDLTQKVADLRSYGINRVVAINGVLESGFERVYTREEILAMTVAQLDEVERPLNLEGYYDMLKAEKQTAILEALEL